MKTACSVLTALILTLCLAVSVWADADPAKTPEARKKNRRTEIILTPKLDELLKVLGNN